MDAESASAAIKALNNNDFGGRDLAVNETLLLNLFFAGTISSMPPRLESNDGRNTVIRPLAEVAEAELIAYAAELRIPVIPCNLCGSQETQRRAEMKALLAELDSRYPGLRASMLTAQRNVRPSQLMYGHS